MPQSLASIYLHFIFSTKNRLPCLAPDKLAAVFEFIGGIVRDCGGAMVAAGGSVDHVHLLISLDRETTSAELMRQVKGSSSRWIHERYPDLGSFAWQAGYGVFSVSRSRVDAVRRYLDGQAEHHKTVTFQEEYRAFLERHGLAFDERFVWD